MAGRRPVLGPWRRHTQPGAIPSMSASARTRTITTAALQARMGGTPMVSPTANTTPMARIVDAHADVVLVGDSLGVVVHSLPSTLGLTPEMMTLHGQAVRRSCERALIVIDLPFGSYQASPEQAFRSAARVMAETGCGAVKLKGGVAMAPTIAFLTGRGIPVMAHVRLQPQSVNVTGGYKLQGRGADAEKVLADAKALAEAGAFAVALEKIAEPLARRITEAVAIPMIGIGASAQCDGQVLVLNDMLGLFGDFQPSFVRRYAELGQAVKAAVAAYAGDVRVRAFPAAEHVFPD